MDAFYDIPYEGKFPKNGQIIIGQGLANMIGKNINEEIILFSLLTRSMELVFLYEKDENIRYFFY